MSIQRNLLVHCMSIAYWGRTDALYLNVKFKCQKMLFYSNNWQCLNNHYVKQQPSLLIQHTSKRNVIKLKFWHVGSKSRTVSEMGWDNQTTRHLAELCFATVPRSVETSTTEHRRRTLRHWQNSIRDERTSRGCVQLVEPWRWQHYGLGQHLWPNQETSGGFGRKYQHYISPPFVHPFLLQKPWTMFRLDNARPRQHVL